MTASGPPSASIGRERLQTLAFLVVLPALNTTIAGFLLLNLDAGGSGALLSAGLRMWATFAASLGLLRLVKARWPWALDEDAFWRQLLVHAVIVIAMGYAFGPFLEVPASLPRPRLVVVPRIVVSLQLEIGRASCRERVCHRV